MKKSLELIKRHEGVRLEPYNDSLGILTIGVGHNLENGLSDAVVDQIFIEDMESVYEDCNKFKWYSELNDARKAVIENMIFNMGYNRFFKFKNTINLISMYEYQAASIEMLESKWADQVGRRAIELSKMMKSGEF